MTAGIELAEALMAYRENNVVVYALPRGGVPVAAPIARALDAPLELAVTRKIGHPESLEFAVAAITEDGEYLADPVEEPLLDEKWLLEAKAQELAEAKRRRELYVHGAAPISAKGKTAIVVDDGIATGLTLRAALRMLKRQSPERLIAAVPVAPFDTATEIRDEGFEVVALYEPKVFLGGIGAYYQDFEQLNDDEVVSILSESREA